MNEPDAKKSPNRITDLEKGLYQRDFKTTLPPTQQRFSPHGPADVEKLWHNDDLPPGQTLPPQVTKIVAGSFFRKILTFAIIFFTVSAGLLVYMFYGGWNVISANNVDVSFLGPVTISAGSELDFDVVISNQNHSPIENVTLYIDYPDGTKAAQNITADFLHDKQSVGEILSNGSVHRTARSILFGELNSLQNLKVAVTYGLKNSNATFRKEKTYDVSISSTPLTIQITHPKQTVSGEQVDFDALVSSNSSVPLTNILLKIDYPFGFSFTSADPQPTYDSNYWLIPTLSPGEKKHFSIRGGLQGEEGDERVFRYSIGAQNANNNKAIAVRYLSQPESVFVQKTPLAVSLVLDNSSNSTFVTTQGNNILGTVLVTNNTPSIITNAAVRVAFSGALYDAQSVRAGQGFFQSIDNTILWDKMSNSHLASLQPGDSVSLSFNFSTLQPGNAPLKNGKMGIVASVRGEDSSQGSVSHALSYSQTKVVQTQSSVAVGSNLTFSIGPFANKGAVPPKVNLPTTYTVTLSAKDSTNDARAAEVHAFLPIYVHWLGVTSPSSEVLTWNPDKSEVIWRIGDMVAGTGYGRPQRQVSFQIQLLPSLSQVGTSPDVLQGVDINAIDSFTSATLENSTDNLTTQMPTDPKFSSDPGAVVR